MKKKERKKKTQNKNQSKIKSREVVVCLEKRLAFDWERWWGTMSKSLKKSDQNLTDFRNLILLILSSSTAHLIPSYNQKTFSNLFPLLFSISEAGLEGGARGVKALNFASALMHWDMWDKFWPPWILSTSRFPSIYYFILQC